MPLILFIAAYLLLVFPFAYFRHDDWLALGNGTWVLAQNWKSAFSPTLYVNSVPEVWFFRPLFKFGYGLFYDIFGLHYYYWLAATLLMTFGALIAGARALNGLTRHRSHAYLFVVLFTASVHLHFGSLVWAGEGLMNCPQVFLLFVNAALFVSATEHRRASHRRWRFFLALLCFTLALGFKESSVFHAAFLAALLYAEEPFQKIPWRRRALWLTPYAIVGGTYLFIRLVKMPVNPGYVPLFTMDLLVPQLGFLFAALVLPVFVLWIHNVFSRNLSKESAGSHPRRWVYLLFIAVSILPYLGHPFFSPGWLMLPGFYATFFIALSVPISGARPRFIRRVGISLLFLSVFAVTARLNAMAWWKWSAPERQIVDLLQAYPQGRITTLVIHDCPNPKYPGASLSRVVASPEGLQEVWRLVHGSTIQVDVQGCAEESRVPSSRDALHLQWMFPEFKVLD